MQIHILSDNNTDSDQLASSEKPTDLDLHSLQKLNKMPNPLLIFIQSDYLMNSHT